MKRSACSTLLVAALVVSIGLTGCRTKPKNLTPIPGRSAEVVPVPQPPPPVVHTTPVIPQGGLPQGGNTGPGSGATANPLPPPTLDPSTGGIATTALEEFDGMTVDRAAFKAHTVYFDFDKATVRTADRGNIEAVANELKAKPANKLLVEGHCDERGTEGYNLALGERRALAVREYLSNLGIDANRVRTISYGEARPEVDGKDEAAYSKNRRGQFVLLLPK